MAVRRSRRRAIVMNLGVALVTLATIAPLAWMVTVSFMPRGESNAFPPPFLPSRWSWENYYELLARRLFTSAGTIR